MATNPSVTQSIISPSQLATVSDRTVLMLGILAGGTALDSQLQENIQSGDEDGLFGEKSCLSLMIREFRDLNELTVIDAIGFDDPTGTAYTATITLTGTATADSSLVAFVGSARNEISLGITAGDTNETIAANLQASISELEGDQPFASTVVSNVITLTAVDNTGSLSSAPIVISGLPAGVTASIAGFSGTAALVDRTTALDNLGNRRYTTVVTQFDDTDDEQEWLDGRFNTTNQVLDGVLIACRGYGDTTSIESDVLAINSQSVNLIADRVQGITSPINYSGSSNGFPSFVISSQVAAVRSLRLTDGAPISDILSVTGSRNDSFGGPHISTLPYFNTEITTGKILEKAENWTLTEIKSIADYGASTVTPNTSKSAVIMNEQTTTRKTNAAGNDDTTYQFLNYVDTSSVIREYFVVNLQSKYAQSRLTDNDLVSGYSMANAASIRAFMRLLYKQLSLIAVTQAGTVAEQDFNDNMTISIDVSTGEATIDTAPLQVGQLRVIIGTITVNRG